MMIIFFKVWTGGPQLLMPLNEEAEINRLSVSEIKLKIEGPGYFTLDLTISSDANFIQLCRGHIYVNKF
jgi:hypothetical protein